MPRAMRTERHESMNVMVSGHFYRVILAIVAAAILACIFTIFTATAERAEGSALVQTDGLVGPRCSERGWPYYEPQCLRGPQSWRSQMRPYRTVTTERW